MSYEGVYIHADGGPNANAHPTGIAVVPSERGDGSLVYIRIDYMHEGRDRATDMLLDEQQATDLAVAVLSSMIISKLVYPA